MSKINLLFSCTIKFRGEALQSMLLQRNKLSSISFPYRSQDRQVHRKLQKANLTVPVYSILNSFYRWVFKPIFSIAFLPKISLVTHTFLSFATIIMEYEVKGKILKSLFLNIQYMIDSIDKLIFLVKIPVKSHCWK